MQDDVLSAGRKRMSGPALPVRMYLYRKSYYYIPKGGSRINLGRDFDSAMRSYREVTGSSARVVCGEDSDVTRMYRSARTSSKQRNLGMTITREDVVRLLERANGKCELTGIAFNSFSTNGSRRRPWIPSLDRIDTSKGYDFGNLRVVCGAVNIAISDFGIDVLVQIAKKLKKNISL